VNETPFGVQVDVQIEATLDVPGETLQSVLRQAIMAAVTEVGEAVTGEMALVLTGDERMRELNQTYRGIDSTTDVLSFAAMDDGDAGQFVLPAEMPAYLGDVVISWPQAQRQAEERGHAVEGELCLLAIHGLLHLIGQDHAETSGRAGIWAIQHAALRRLGYDDVKPADE
jgi:probable rRNA maturation factor